MAKIILYVYDEEIIVTTKKEEAQTLKEYFNEDTERDLFLYDRKEIDKSFAISNRLTINWEK